MERLVLYIVELYNFVEKIRLVWFLLSGTKWFFDFYSVIIEFRLKTNHVHKDLKDTSIDFLTFWSKFLECCIKKNIL